MIVLVLSGIPGSGKTTLAQQLASRHGAILYSYDEFRMGTRPQESRQAHQRMHRDIASDLRNGHDVVVDDLHLTKEWREDLLEAVRDIPCRKVLIVLTTPLEECLGRNAGRQRRLPDGVIHHLHGRYQPPEKEEGWDDIVFGGDVDACIENRSTE